MKNKTKHIIKKIEPGSIAEELELEPGDELLRVNGEEIEDVFDYHFQTNDSYLELTIRKKNGEEWDLEIEKEYDEEIGITFENEFMDQYRSCSNNCIFCFIDQMPPGMRPTLYFKDDDSRLSFLQGNYITLTNMSDHDIDRIIRYHLAPINISFQATNPELRCKMLHNRFAGDIFPKVQRLFEAGIEMNGQIVLCKGLNDKEELKRSIKDLSKYLPHLRSVSVVPVGLSKFRDGLYPLEPFEKQDAEEVIDLIESWQKKLYEAYGLHFIHASDEWYLLAGRKLPEEERYDGYLQLENGVGMLRLLETEVEEALEQREGDERKLELSFATGRLAYGFIRRYMDWIQEKYPNVKVHGYQIVNDFFGEKITVSGLLTGQDVIAQLKNKELGEYLLLPCNLLRSGENVFLDDRTVEAVEKELKIPVKIVEEDGASLVSAVLEKDAGRAHRRRQMYEQTDCSDCRET